MSTVATTYTFVAGATAQAAQVNTNFTDLVNYINTNAIVKDGSKAMTAALTLVSNGPTATTHATHKDYVDTVSRGARPYINTATLSAGTSAAWPSFLASGTLITPTYASKLLVIASMTIKSNGVGDIDVRVESQPIGTVYTVNGVNTLGAQPYQRVPTPTPDVWHTAVITGTANFAANAAVAYNLTYRVNSIQNATIHAHSVAYVSPQ